MISHLKIASLLSCATEMVCALGLRDNLVAVSHGCDYPADVRTLPIVTESKIDSNASGAEIDRQVRETVRQSGSVYRIKTDRLKQLDPDVIITQKQCEVCAVSFNDVVQAVQELQRSDIKILALNPMTLADIFQEIKQLGLALNAEERAESILANIQKRLGIVRQFAQGIAKPTVAFIEWIDPMMIGGNWIPEMIDLAGGIPAGGQAGHHSEFIEADFLIEANPDVIVIAPCGFTIERSLREWMPLKEKPWWHLLKAVQDRRVYITDGHYFFNRSGPRIVDSVEILSYILQPESRKHYGHLENTIVHIH